MFIKSINLKNFKGFKNINIDLNSKTNIIIGENNIGKSSIFEAILLWKKCYDKIIRPNGSSFYKIDKMGQYIPFIELRFVRIINDTDLFYSSPNISTITLVIKYKDSEYELIFEISKPQSIKNSYLRFRTKNHESFEKFASILKADKIKLTDAIFVYQAKPISNILDKEPFMNKGQVLKKILLGKSGEVLRNKIIQHDDDGIKRIATQVSKVLGYNVKFYCNNRTKEYIEEYIDLRTEIDNKKHDLHLQGSGLLQITEIFSTIELMSEKSVNLLLVDEPDSHIHTKLQKKLLNEIKNISNVQSFIISHNDNFVSESEEGELYYLNKKAKEEKFLKPLKLEDYNIIKRELGGIILALENFNSAKLICFVEGYDDIDYIQKLKNKYLEVTNKEVISEPMFLYLRGKGDLIRKIDYYKRLITQIDKDKIYKLVYDKDYSTEKSSEEYENNIKRKNNNEFQIFKHDGYCIESSLFSSTDILIKLLNILSEVPIPKIGEFLNHYYMNLGNDLSDIKSERHEKMNNKFKSQKTEERPELKDVEFSDFIKCALNGNNNKIQYLFNKDIIKDLILSFNTKFETKILDTNEDDSSEFYSSTLFNKYIENISSQDDFLPNSIELLYFLFEFEENVR